VENWKIKRAERCVTAISKRVNFINRWGKLYYRKNKNYCEEIEIANFDSSKQRISP
jgi:hypothetical protein